MSFLLPALLLGVLGSLHCLAMCGPLAVAISRVGGASAGGRLGYQSGRVMTYAGLGAVAGLVGRPLDAVAFQQYVSLGVGGAVILWTICRFRPLPVPRMVIGWIQWLKRLFARQLTREGGGRLVILGLLNGLLPCGLVYMALAGAVLTGSWLRGAGFMAVFGAGTLPMMAAISLIGLHLRDRVPLRLARVLPVASLLIGSLLILRGMSLGIPYLSPALGASVEACGCH
ncbi:MAG: sulfite exporter TauE/SafE family protein [Verrucomicrobiota bacterium]